MGNSQDRVCRTCKHLHMDGELAECRKHAPQATTSPWNKERTRWPYVDLDDYCDEWKEKKEKATSKQYKDIFKKSQKPPDPNKGLLDY